MVAVFVVATSLLLALPVLAEPTPSHLAARQLTGFDPSSIPAACQTTCKSLVDTLSSGSCSTLDCLCTNTIATGIKSCLQCGVDAKVTGLNQTIADTTVKSFTDSCNAAGKTVTASGSSSGSSSSSASAASGSSTGTAGKSGAMAMGFSVAGVVVAGALGIFSLA